MQTNVKCKCNVKVGLGPCARFKRPNQVLQMCFFTTALNDEQVHSSNMYTIIRHRKALGICYSIRSQYKSVTFFISLNTINKINQLFSLLTYGNKNKAYVISPQCSIAPDTKSGIAIMSCFGNG